MSDLILPFLILSLIIFATYKKVNVYSCFCSGAKGSFNLILGIFPYIVAIMVCVALFRACGLSLVLVKLLTPLFTFFGIPVEVCELVLLRPFSGSGSLSLLENILTTYGADSYISRCACCILGSSETIFYVSSVYFANTKINIAPAILISLFGSIISAILSCLFCRII